MKSIFEELGGTYSWEGDYLIPNIELPEQEEYQLGKYGRLHRSFLKEYHPARYSSLILKGQLWNHLVEIDKLCTDRMEVMIDAMKQQEGVTEVLKAKDQMEGVRRTPMRSNSPSRLTGLLYCADCGAKLTHRCNLVSDKWLDDVFVCSSYQQLTHDCTMHYIPIQKIEAAILSMIQRISWYVQHNEQEFLAQVRSASDLRQEETVKAYRRKIMQAKRRHKELEGLVKKLYERNTTGKIPDKHFTRLLDEYDEEQIQIESDLSK